MAKSEKRKFSEKDIDQYFRKKVKKLGGLALKLESPFYTGFPDRTVLLPKGEVFFAEMKSTVGKATPKQKAVHRILRKLGFTVFVINSKELADEILEKYEKGEN